MLEKIFPFLCGKKDTEPERILPTTKPFDKKLLETVSGAKKTEEWYSTEGWLPISRWLTEFTKLNRVYIENFDVIPSFVNKKELVKIFNDDSEMWKMTVDADGELVCVHQ